MNAVQVSCALLALGLSSACAAAPPKRPWIGLHLGAPGSAQSLAALETLVSEQFRPLGINLLVLEVSGSGYRFECDPKLKAYGGSMDKAQARELAAVCRKNGVRLVPLLNCVGHQSWEKTTYPFLLAHPEFDETPGKYPDNQGIYCRSWCVSNPDVYKAVNAMFDELIDAFQCDAVHVGMDEVFIIGDPDCPRCAGKQTGVLFSTAIKKLHDHLVGKRHVQMMMWGDRLLDSRQFPYGTWEAADNGTHTAVHNIPKGIVVFDWHYEPMDDYPSVRFFQKLGLSVVPSGWKNLEATKALMACAKKDATPRMMGHLFTGWGCSPEGLLEAFRATEDRPDRAENISWMVAKIIKQCASVNGKR